MVTGRAGGGAAGPGTSPGWAAHVRDVTVVPGLSGTTGTVRWAVETEGADGLGVRVVLRDAEGAEVAGGTGPAGELLVADVHPWRPGEGYLYDLDVLLEDGERVVDAYRLPVGVRTVEVRGTEFLVNGDPFRFRGFGRHEDAPVRGKGHDDALMSRSRTPRQLSHGSSRCSPSPASSTRPDRWAA